MHYLITKTADERFIIKHEFLTPMKIIDENGMVFGKINIIDLTVLLFFGILLFTGYNYLYLKNLPQNVLDQVVEEPIFTLVNITITSDMSPLLFDAVKAGDTMKRTDILERNVTIGTVVAKESELHVNQSEDIKTNITLTLFVEKKLERYYFEEVPLRIPNLFIFVTSTYQIEGIITKIEEI